MSATPQQVRLWSDEVAADPGSRAFLPLAEHYRGAGRRDVALRLVVRGLERHPHDVEAHYLLGVLYRDGGELVKAFDEWDIALALAPEHHGSRREIGLLSWRRGDWAVAVRHLERARENDIEDEEVRVALEDAWSRSRGGRGAARDLDLPVDLALDDEPWAASAPDPDPAPTIAAGPTPAPAAAPAMAADAGTAVAPAPSSADGERWAGGREFDSLAADFHALAAERGIVGAVMLDGQGYVLAGEMHVGGRDRGPEIAAVLSPASVEAERTLRHLGLGAWQGILVETGEHVVRLSPTEDGGMVAVAGSRQVPMGWVLRVAARAKDAASRFLAALNGEGR
ncbi:MAG TPA: tetratricopeptide repeat protein [Longimicrobium sp.]|nr:tetratricopeptide repeat protein [Longimicrobium sp.]